MIILSIYWEVLWLLFGLYSNNFSLCDKLFLTFSNKNTKFSYVYSTKIGFLYHKREKKVKGPKCGWPSEAPQMTQHGILDTEGIKSIGTTPISAFLIHKNQSMEKKTIPEIL